MLNWKRILGWIAFVIWCCIGLTVMWLPFSGFKTKDIALSMAILFGINKIFLILIVFLLGEKYIQRIKSWLLKKWRRE